jgi:hypothetical protein
VSEGRLGPNVVRRLVGIGQRWAHRREEMVVVIYQVHRGERTVEAHRVGEDPRVPHTRFVLAFPELGAKYRLLDEGDSREAA